MHLILHYRPPPGCAGDTPPPAWVPALARRPGFVLTPDLPRALFGTPRALVLGNPVFSPELADLVARARALACPVIGVFETLDFDLGEWADSPLQRHPVAARHTLLHHMHDMARSLALCDHLLATGPAMAGRLRARLPGRPVGWLPPAAPPGLAAGADTARPDRRARRAVFLPAQPADRLALLPHGAGLRHALDETGATLLVCDETRLPPELETAPGLERCPAPRDAAARARCYAKGAVALFPPSGGGTWQTGAAAAGWLPALAAGATCLGAVPDQLRTAGWPGPPLLGVSGDWTYDLRHALDGPQPRQPGLRPRRALWWWRYRPPRTAARLHRQVLRARA